MSKPIYLYKTPFHKLLYVHNKNAPFSLFELPNSDLRDIKLSVEPVASYSMNVCYLQNVNYIPVMCLECGAGIKTILNAQEWSHIFALLPIYFHSAHY